MFDLALMERVQKIADWFIQLPTKLVDAIMDPQVHFYERRERIQKARELQAIREIGMTIQTLYLFKGNVYTWANHLQAQKEVEDVQYVRELFREIVQSMDYIWEALSETPLSNLELGAEISKWLAEARGTYSALAEAPDADILGDRGLLDILAAMDSMQQTGSFLIRLVDGHRQKLDYMG
jgi:hypothetical protein